MPTTIVSRRALREVAQAYQTVFDLTAEVDRLDDRVRHLELTLSVLLAHPAVRDLVGLDNPLDLSGCARLTAVKRNDTTPQAPEGGLSGPEGSPSAHRGGHSGSSQR